jgi:hypothetical protein
MGHVQTAQLRREKSDPLRCETTMGAVAPALLPRRGVHQGQNQWADSSPPREGFGEWIQQRFALDAPLLMVYPLVYSYQIAHNTARFALALRVEGREALPVDLFLSLSQCNLGESPVSLRVVVLP